METKAKNLKGKTAKEIFAFASAFARCEWVLRVTHTRYPPKFLVFNQLNSLFSQPVLISCFLTMCGINSLYSNEENFVVEYFI